MIFVTSFHFRRQQISELQCWQISPSLLPEFYSALKKIPGFKEGLYLATCNRCELYGVVESNETKKKMIELWWKFCPQGKKIESSLHFFEQEAARHLFHVASSLDSMVLGETEILGQVRKAYLCALESQITGPILNKIFQQALATAKYVRTETELGKNPVSVATVAMKLAETIFGDFRPIQAMILGAGEIAGKVAEYLVKREVGSLLISNRTLENAGRLAGLWNANVIPFENWPKKLGEINLLLTCLQSSTPIVSATLLQRQPASCHGIKKLCVIDFGVPRNTEDLPQSPEGFYHYHMDDLKMIAETNRTLRQQEVSAVQKRIEEDLEKLFRRWNQPCHWVAKGSMVPEAIAISPTR